MSLSTRTVAELLQAFSAPTPTPGGGSAAALVGALAASLLAMVAGMPKTKAGTAEDRASLEDARAALLRHRDELLELADLDAAAYDSVMLAYRLPTETPEQRAAREQAIQGAIRAATDVPLQTARACVALAPLARTVAERGNPSAKSDVVVALGLAMAGWSGGLANVTVNLEHAGDPAYVEAVRTELGRLREAVAQEAAPTYRALGIIGHD